MRSGSSAITARRSAGVKCVQPAISSRVRPQPRHQPDAVSIVHTSVHGLSMPTVTGADASTDGVKR